jgi:hypothetical protein
MVMNGGRMRRERRESERVTEYEGDRKKESKQASKKETQEKFKRKKTKVLNVQQRNSSGLWCFKIMLECFPLLLPSL